MTSQSQTASSTREASQAVESTFPVVDSLSFSFIQRALSKLGGLAHFVLKRRWHHPGLTLLALLGVILAVGLVTNASFFSTAVGQAIFDRRLEEFSRKKERPVFSTRAYVLPSSRNPMSLDAAERAAQDVANTLSSEIGLPVKHLGIEVDSGGLMLYPPEEAELYGESSLGTIHLIYKAGIADHIEAVEGEPFSEEEVSTEAMDVWMHNRLAQKMGVHIGEEFNIGVIGADTSLPIRLRGFWQARDPEADYWFSDPDTSMKSALLVHRQDYVSRVQPLIPSRARFVAWHIILDQRRAIATNARQYLDGFHRGLAIVNKYLPGIELDTPPLEPLEEFVHRETTLAILLLGFNIPSFGFLLYFLTLTSFIITRWQRGEIATFVSRGMSTSGVLSITVIEEFLLFLVGCPAGIGFGMLLARMMGYTASFLSFTSRPPLPVALRMVDLRLVLAALGVNLVARLWPAAQAARQDVIEIGQERARPAKGPFWYRYYLDLLLILPTVYAYTQLAQKGTLALLVRDRPEDLYRDPLLILVPALFILTAALVAMRIFPLIMRLIDRLASVTPWITPHLAFRQLGRQSQSYINPLLLIIVSLALGVYSLSMASSLDQWLVDRMYYRVGADLAFTPWLQSGEGEGQMVPGDSMPLPAEFRDLPGVTAATRVGDYPAQANLSAKEEIKGRFLAIDRLDFPSVSWFRGDFAGEPLGALMNRLALSPNSVLVSQRVLDENYLQIGDDMHLEVKVVPDEVEIHSSFKVVGAYEYFPTVYEQDTRTTVIGNLDYLSQQIGVTPPHRIWLRTKENVKGEDVFASVEHTGIDTTREGDSRALIAEEQAKLERVGVFGTLSVGFLAAVLMAAMALLIYSYSSLRERLYRFTVLRAVGLMRQQIAAQVILEYVFLVVYSAVVGTIIGTLASELFVPFFRVTGEKGTPLPPLMPIVARGKIGYLAAVFVSAMVLMEVAIIVRSLSQHHFSLLREHPGG